jgi:large subunit ribosomal protein L24
MIVLSFFQVKKHIKQGEGHTGGIFSIEAPLHVSNVQIVDPVTAYVYDT